ncbi:MAG: serine hydrolase, partial [Gemmatimonadota bacterium]|nr:serine hydrolase [Gemmatimonadota bacterium]
GQRRYPNAPEYTWTHTGAGSNLIYVDPENELVIVCRWIQGGAFTDVVHTVLEAMGEVAEN